MMRPASALFLALGLALSGTAAVSLAGPYQKWVDENGVTHYGEKAPKGVAATTVNVMEDTPSDAEAELQKLQERRAAAQGGDKGKGGTPAPAPLSDSEKTALQANCDQHRRNLDALKSGARVSVKDDKTGEMRYLESTEVQAKIKATEEQIRICEETYRIKAGADTTAPARPPATP